MIVINTNWPAGGEPVAKSVHVITDRRVPPCLSDSVTVTVCHDSTLSTNDCRIVYIANDITVTLRGSHIREFDDMCTDVYNAVADLRTDNQAVVIAADFVHSDEFPLVAWLAFALAPQTPRIWDAIRILHTRVRSKCALHNLEKVMRRLGAASDDSLGEFIYDMREYNFEHFGRFTPTPVPGVDGLYLGTIADTSEVILRELGIKHVASFSPENHERINKVKSDMPIHWLVNNKLHDGGMSALHLFEEFCKFVDEVPPGEPILVHCRIGYSRSPTMVIAYMSWYGSTK